jgi:hypothetical protein
MCGSASGAGFCVVPVVPKAIDRAEAVFSGKIVDIVKVRRNNSSSPSSSSEYIVKFEIEDGGREPNPGNCGFCGARRYSLVPIIP